MITSLSANMNSELGLCSRTLVSRTKCLASGLCVMIIRGTGGPPVFFLAKDMGGPPMPLVFQWFRGTGGPPVFPRRSHGRAAHATEFSMIPLDCEDPENLS